MKAQLKESNATYVAEEKQHNLMQQQYARQIDAHKAKSESLQHKLDEMERGDLNECKNMITALQQHTTKLSGNMDSMMKSQKSQMKSLQKEKEDLKSMTASLREAMKEMER